MWHTTEIIAIFVKITEEYSYEVYHDRKRCVALCGDLLAEYGKERKVMQMLFQAGFGDVLPYVPYDSEQQLKVGLQHVENFLMQQAIELSTRDNIIHLVKSVFATDDLKIAHTPFESKVVKTFSELHFKVTIPVAVEFDERVQFTFQFMWNKCEQSIDTVLEKCVITDRVKVVHSSQMDYSLFPHKKNGKGIISVKHDTRKIFLSDATIEFTFLCSNKERVVVSYMADRSHKLSLKQIEICPMGEEEMEKAANITQLLLKIPKVSPETDPIAKGDSISIVVPAYTSSDIQEFSDALRKEILFLKQGKGKKYKIVNGERINKDKGIFTYTFELETELHLPDDAPVVVEASNGLRAVGTVLLCEDFQIMLLLDRDLNDKVNSAYLMVEPWKLLESLDKRMTSLNPNVNRLAVEFMENGPKLATTKDISNVPMGQDEVIDKLQRDDIVTVWGPPGTGKTYTMAKIAMNYLHNGKSVLIVSHSNVSVDGVIKKVVDMMDSDMQSYIQNGKVLRFGYVRDDELAQHQNATSFNFALVKSPDLSRQLDNLNINRDELRAKNQIKTPSYDEVEKKIKTVRDEIRKEERRYVEKAQLLGTTISRATVDPMFDEKQFDLVMFDEVSMAYVPQVIAAAALAKEKFLCVGDFRQLAPIAQGQDSKKVLQADAFSYLQIVDGVGNMYWHPWLVMLNEQRRMHPAISEFPNKYVYKNLLKNHASVAYIRNNIVMEEPLSGDAVNLIDLSGSYCAASKNSDNSRYNILSAIVSFSTAVKAQKNGAGSVGIITPYAAQTRLIRAMIRDYYGQSTTISCATVHQFQGSESDVLIFDAVESYPGNKVGFLMGKVPNEVVRLINVAITRARGKLITVANARFWENTFKGTNHIFYRLLCHTQEKHTVINQKDRTLKPYIETIDPGKMIRVYTDEAKAMEELYKDMQRASGKVIFSIPDGELRENACKVLSMIDEVEDRGVDILMKSNDYQGLPESWKRYCWGTENAVFPLIIIDDETAWYGLPTSKLKFKVDKSTTYITVLHTMVRIKGKNTIEMIKALTDLETVQIGNTMRPLTTKNGQISLGDVDTEKPGVHGLAAFIEEKEYCPVCRKHMKLARNSKGTAYIRCSNKDCRHMDFLSPEIMNWYLSTRNVKCPKNDGGLLKGMVSKYGPYITCDRGHILKPDEI